MFRPTELQAMNGLMQRLAGHLPEDDGDKSEEIEVSFV